MTEMTYARYLALDTLLACQHPQSALTALIDGMWLELSLGTAPFFPEEAEALAKRWIDTLLT